MLPCKVNTVNTSKVRREQLSVSKTFARHIQRLLHSAAEETEQRDRLQVPTFEFQGLAQTRANKTIGRAKDLLKSIEERIRELQRLVVRALRLLLL